MTESLEFTSGIRRNEPITFTLDGKQFTVIPAKEAVRILENKFTWFDHGLNAADWDALPDEARRVAHGLNPEGDEPEGEGWVPTPATAPEGWQGSQAAELEKRLRDPADNFDVSDLDRVIIGIEDKVAARPTT